MISYNDSEQSAGTPAPGRLPKKPSEVLDITEILRENRRELPRNDSDNALQFCDIHHRRIRFVPERKSWLIWTDGHGWKWDYTRAVVELARVYARSIERFVLEIDDPKLRADAFKKAITYGDEKKINAMLSLASSDARVVAPDATLDADPWRAGTADGSIDLRTGEFSAPDPQHLITKRLASGFDPRARCPAWDAFLERVLPDPELRRFLRASVGYSLTGLTVKHHFWFLFGSGSNGKTTFLETVRALVHGYGQTAPEAMLAINPHGGQPKAELARLPGVRFLSGSEVSEGMKLNESLLKSLTGADTITGEAKYCAPFDFKPQAKIWMFGNHRPVITGTESGIWRRVLLVPFTQEITGEEKDEDLPQKLLAEMPGILNWALAGLKDWRENDFLIPACVLEATAQYRAASDVLGEFVGETVQDAPDCFLPISEVYERYRQWCESEGMKHHWTARTLNARLSDRGFQQTRRGGVRLWQNIGWTPRDA